MLKRKFFKRNYFYGKLDLKPYKKVYEVFKTVWEAKKDLLHFRRIKKFYTPENLVNWTDYQAPIKNSEKPVITWIGQATFLIQIDGMNILTDPVFSKLSTIYPRNFKPGIELHNLPKIDLILISHNHRDHMEKSSIKFLIKRDNPKIFLGNGNKRCFAKKNLNNFQEFDWWQNENFKNLSLCFLPAIHWSGTGLHDINRSLWGSWMIEHNNFKIYFAGDTAYSMHFTEISSKFADIDLALMPIGPNEPRDFQKHSHIDAHESVKAFIDLKAKNFIPMHWGTYCLGTDTFDLPIKKLKYSWQENIETLKDKNLHLAKFGQQLRF